MRCAVYNCKNNNNHKRKNFRFFTFPKDEELSKKWMKFCRRKDQINPRTSCICEVHFSPENFERNLRYEMGFSSINPTKLLRGAVPTVYMKPAISPREYERQERLKKEATKKMIESLLKPQSPSFELIEFQEKPVEINVDQTQHIRRLEEEVENLKKETQHMKEVQKSQEAEIEHIKAFLKDYELQRDSIKCIFEL